MHVRMLRVQWTWTCSLLGGKHMMLRLCIPLITWRNRLWYTNEQSRDTGHRRLAEVRQRRRGTWRTWEVIFVERPALGLESQSKLLAADRKQRGDLRLQWMEWVVAKASMAVAEATPSKKRKFRSMADPELLGEQAEDAPFVISAAADTKVMV